jgi:hypothetical protein
MVSLPNSTGAPAAVDRDGRSGDVGAGRSAQQSDKGGDALGRHELARRLACREEGALDLLARLARLRLSASSRPSILGVGMVPGQMALQVMLVRAVSSAMARVKPISAVLVVT